jgi:hypothetical protein
MPPRELLADLSLDYDPDAPQRPFNRRRLAGKSQRVVGLVGISLLMLLGVGAAVAQVLDGGNLDVQVATTGDCASDETNVGALVDYIGVDCTNLGSAGSGIFQSFVRLQNGGSEQGYNTDAQKFEFDEKAGNFTHHILVSDIPVVTDPAHPGVLYWELYADINESNANDITAARISLNDMEVYFTAEPALTGYPFDNPPTTDEAELIYDFGGSILIYDVNSGSGEADLRYRIPLTNISIPTDCTYKNPDCETYFVLYSRWGTTANYPTDPAGFEEWKVKTYPFVAVSKDATTTFTRTFNWTIDKSVTPDTWNLFTGDTGTSEYTVAVVKSAPVDSAWAVSGTIVIDNPGDLDAVITSVGDVISGAPTTANVDCGVTFPHTLLAGDTLECSYDSALPNGSSQTNTATVALEEGGVFTGTAAVTFGTPTTTVRDTINVTDDVQGSLGSFSASGSTTYTHQFACDADEGTNDNTATIVETGQNDSASVTVNCYGLDVTKDAATGFTRTYHWIIDKSSTDSTTLTLNPGEPFLYHYSVEVDLDDPPYTDSAAGVTGNITVHNPAPITATINSVSDVVSGVGAATVVCTGITFPYDLAAGGDLNCTYSLALPDDTDRTNTATAVLQNHDYDKDLFATASGTTNFSGNADVTFAGATMTEIDECIDVTDTYAGALGTVCVSDPPPHTFTYTRTLQFTEADCGENTVENTASFLTNDTQTPGSDTWTVVVTVPCPQGCTLTQGYWKTHSSYGPAPEDPNWLLLPGGLGPDTPFFTSGQTWYQVFWTPPKKGNAYYILAHQYEAAVLNKLSGAGSTPAVDAAITFAETFFGSHTPTSTLSKAERAAVIAAAGVLGSYNEGAIGPGHCSEDTIALAGATATSPTALGAIFPIGLLPFGLPALFAMWRRRRP